MIEVEAEGIIFEFPDGTENAVMGNAVRNYFQAQTPEVAPEVTPEVPVREKPLTGAGGGFPEPPPFSAVGMAKATGLGLARGVTEELPATIGRAAQFIGDVAARPTVEIPEEFSDIVKILSKVDKIVSVPKQLVGRLVGKLGKHTVDISEALGQKMYGEEVDPDTQNKFEQIAYEGSKMLGPSLIPLKAFSYGARYISGIGKLVKGAKNAKLVGDQATANMLLMHARDLAKYANKLASGAVASTFGASQAQSTAETALQRADKLEKDGHIDAARAMREAASGLAPFITGTIEGVGEYFGTKYLGKLFNMDGAVIAKRGAMEVVRDFLRTLGVELGTEFGQALGQAAVEKAADIRPEADPLGEALDVLGPTAYMTMLTGGLAAGATGVQRVSEKKLEKEQLKTLKGLEKEEKPVAKLEGARVGKKAPPSVPIEKKPLEKKPDLDITGKPSLEERPDVIRGQKAKADMVLAAIKTGKLSKDVALSKFIKTERDRIAKAVKDPKIKMNKTVEAEQLKVVAELEKKIKAVETKEPVVPKVAKPQPKPKVAEEKKQTAEAMAKYIEGTADIESATRDGVKKGEELPEAYYVRQKYEGENFVKTSINPKDIEVPPGQIIKEYLDRIKKIGVEKTPAPVVHIGSKGTLTKIDGNHRIKAAQDQGLKKLDVWVPEDQLAKIKKLSKPKVAKPPKPKVPEKKQPKIAPKPQKPEIIGKKLPKKPSPIIPKEPPARVVAKPGRAWIKDQQRPITSMREITKGKKKGMVEVTVGGKLTEVRKHIIPKDKIITAPEIVAPEDALTKAEQKLAADIAAKEGDLTMPGGFIDLGEGEATPRTEAPFEYENKEQEREFKESQGIRKESFWKRVKDTATGLWHKISRDAYANLPTTGEFAELRNSLLKLSKQKGVSMDKTLRQLHGITVGLNPETSNLFTRKLMLEDFAEMLDEDSKTALPGGFDNESVQKELVRINKAVAGNKIVSAALSKRAALVDAVRDNYVTAMQDIGFDVSSKLKKKNYYRHQILEYANAKGIFGVGKKLKTPTYRGFLRKRTGSEMAINTNYLQAEYEFLTQMQYDIEVAKSIKTVNDNYNIIDKLRAQAKARRKAGETEITWKDLVPAGYAVWQPREGNVFFMADTLPAKLAEQIAVSKLGEIISPDVVRQVLALGGKRKQFVVKEEVAVTLDNLSRDISTNPIALGHKEMIRKWKQWQLVSPRRYTKYNARNLTGDADAAFAGDPAIFLKLPRAVKELYSLYISNKPISGNLKDWFERGGQITTLQAQEMGEFHRELKMFGNLLERAKKKGIKALPATVWKSYWKAARISTDFREALLRYSAYLRAIEVMEKTPDNMPKDFWASRPDEIRGLKDIKDRAFWMSNELLGAYDRVSVMGQALREHMFPFWSWKEVNFKRYIQLFKNAASNKALSAAVARKLTGSLLIRTPYRAYRIGKFMVKASALWAALQAWNHLYFADEEEELPDDVKSRPHIILGRTEDGRIQYFSRLGALADLLEWFGLDAAPQYINDWFNGKRTLKEIAGEMAKSPINVFIQGGEPVIKVGAEILTRRALFPDVFKPRTVRNRGLHLFQSVGLENEYKALFDLPSKPYAESLSKFFAYDVDPMEVAYSNIIQEKHRFMKKLGKWGEGFWITDRGNALYNARLAIRYKDSDAAMRYMGEYLKLGGTLESLSDSLERMDPLSGMTEIEQLSFISQLTKTEQKDLMKAYKFYSDLLVAQPVDTKVGKAGKVLSKPPGFTTIGEAARAKPVQRSRATKKQLKKLLGK